MLAGYALFLGDAGADGMRMRFTLIPKVGGGANEIYLETAAVVTTFILVERYFESRAKRRAGAALTALLEMGAKDVALLDTGGAERRVPIEQLQVGDRIVSSLERGSEPDARAIADAAARESALAPIEAFHNREGLGAEGVIDGHAVVAGRPALLTEWGVELPSNSRVRLGWRKNEVRRPSPPAGTERRVPSSSSPTRSGRRARGDSTTARSRFAARPAHR